MQSSYVYDFDEDLKYLVNVVMQRVINSSGMMDCISTLWALTPNYMLICTVW